MLFDELAREDQMNIVIGDLDVTVRPGEDVVLGTDRDGSVAFSLFGESVARSMKVLEHEWVVEQGCVRGGTNLRPVVY